jgi:hypothetical protein
VCPKEHLYEKDKIAGGFDPQRSSDPPELCFPDYVQVASEYAIQQGPMVTTLFFEAPLSGYEAPAFIGNEELNGNKCRHYRSPPNAWVKVEAWYCPQNNCCIKYSSRHLSDSETELTLVNYSTKVDANAFDLSGYREVSYRELNKILYLFKESDHRLYLGEPATAFLTLPAFQLGDGLTVNVTGKGINDVVLPIAISVAKDPCHDSTDRHLERASFAKDSHGVYSATISCGHLLDQNALYVTYQLIKAGKAKVRVTKHTFSAKGARTTDSQDCEYDIVP